MAGIMSPELANQLAGRGLNARVQTLEELLSGLCDYVEEVRAHYAQRCGSLETNVYGHDRPEPAFPSFREWYEQRVKRAAHEVAASDRRYTGQTLGAGELRQGPVDRYLERER